MKITITNGVVTAVSESKLEALQLVSLTLESRELQPKPEVKVRKHKRHSFLKKCDVCGKEYRGLIGLNSHRSRAHHIRSAGFEQNQKYYAKRQQKAETPKVVISPEFSFR
jgi:hypothetical protein